MVGLASPPARHTTLVGKANCHSWGRTSKEVSPEDLHFLLDPGGQMWSPPKPRLHHNPHSKCLTRGRFLPKDPSYQDVWWQPLLLTLAYAHELQYRAEKVRPSTLSDYGPLVMSIVELKWQVEGHVTFSKHDIFKNLRSTTLEARSWDMGILQGDPITPPSTTDAGDMEPSPIDAQGADNTTSLSPRCPPKDETPPTEPTILPVEADVQDNLPGSAETPPGEDTMVLLPEADTETLKDLLTNGATSPAEVETWVVPATGSVVKLADSPIPSDQVEEERWCVLAMTASIGRLNLEATRVTPRDLVPASVGRVAFGNPQMAATLPGPIKGRKVVGCQDPTVEELAERIWQKTAHKGVTGLGLPMGGRMDGHQKQSNFSIYCQHVIRLLALKYYSSYLLTSLWSIIPPDVVRMVCMCWHDGGRLVVHFSMSFSAVLDLGLILLHLLSLTMILPALWSSMILVSPRWPCFIIMVGDWTVTFEQGWMGACLLPQYLHITRGLWGISQNIHVHHHDTGILLFGLS